MSRGAGEDGAEVAVGRNPAADQDAARSEVLRGVEGSASKVLDDRILKARNEVERLRVEMGKRCCERSRIGRLGVDEVLCAQGSSTLADSCLHPMRLHIAANRSFDAAEGHVEAGRIVMVQAFAGELCSRVAARFLFDLGKGKQVSIRDTV
jgi:hypothetical protein